MSLGGLGGPSCMGLSDCTVEPAIAVSDLDRARRFYEQQLGLTPGEPDEDQGVRYPCGNGTHIFIYLSAENAGRSPATLAGWFVDDLAATMDDLRSRGVGSRFLRVGGGVFDAGRFKAAWMRDPDGNTLALTET